jgi:hypothetical protein
MKHHTHTIALAATLALAGTALPAILLAQAAMPPGPMTFSDMDKNGDGVVTEQEFNEARAKRMSERAAQGYPLRNAGKAPPFSAIDTNGDGKVTPDEFAAGQAAHRQQMMQ